MKNVKKLLGVLLAFCVCSCLLSLTVFAVPAEDDALITEVFNPVSDSLASVSPLADTSSAWTSSDVKNLLNYVVNIRTYTSETSTNTKNNGTTLTTISNTVATISKALGTSQYPTVQNLISTNTSTIVSKLGYGTSGSLHGDLNYLYTELQQISENTSSSGGLGSLAELLTVAQNIEDGLGFDSENTLSDSLGFDSENTLSDSISKFFSYFRSDENFVLFPYSYDEENPADFHTAINMLVNGISVHGGEDKPVLLSDGTVGVPETGSFRTYTLANSLNNSNLGLATILRGGSGATLNNTIYDSQTANDDGTLASTDWSANNILSAFSVLFPIQHDVARLTNVLATGPKIALEKSQEENVQAVTDNFTGDKGVNSDDIGSMSGIGDSLGSVADTGVTITDGFSQVGNSWNFFSAEVAATLDTAPALTADEEDNFIHFYDKNESDFQSLLAEIRGE